MQAQLQFVEIERAVLSDDDFAIGDIACGKIVPQGFEQFGEIAVERFLVAALNQNFLSIAEDDCAEAVPLWLINPILTRGQFFDSLGEHGQNRRIYDKFHPLIISCNWKELYASLAARIFLLSPARASGRRYSILTNEKATFELALKFRSGSATIGEIYSFISGLYFRGKMAYATAFGATSSQQGSSAFVIVPGFGLLPPETVFSPERLRATEQIDVDEDNPRHHDTLLDAAASLDRATGQQCSFVLLGSVASAKYTTALLKVLDQRLLFPAEFVGRGDMSRGGIMLRSAESGQELTYIPVSGAQLRGPRPARLNPRR